MKILNLTILLAIIGTTVYAQSPYRPDSRYTNSGIEEQFGKYRGMEKKKKSLPEMKKRYLMKLNDIQKCLIMADTKKQIVQCDHKILGLAMKINKRHSKMKARDRAPRF